ncbi:sigma-70 family RNA polymerase sigma factor [Pseudomonas sp. ABC1]|nr:sigma-70 family RNA polymerase sigma factor [Pseudomonas sp. ABC1]QLF92364.1 sigma-70 family RNA polymerase sigma factor [Pseudomonas sp. ABC1]
MLDTPRGKDLHRRNTRTMHGRREPQFISSQEDAAMIDTAVERIDRMLAGLPTRARRAFLLNRLEGLPRQMIAERLGVSQGTVERDLRRAFIHCLAPSGECR